MHPTLKAELLALLEARILAGKKATGRTGLDLWQILVLGVVRRGLDADWDRMEHVANYDLLVRQMLGLPATPWDDESKMFSHQTLRDNVALLDDALLQQINARSAAAGREVFAKKAAAPHRNTATRKAALFEELQQRLVEETAVGPHRAQPAVQDERRPPPAPPGADGGCGVPCAGD